MGPSGSGKSTLLHLIGGLDTPSAGSVRVGGEDLSKLNDDRLTLLRRRRIGFVFQAFNLLDVLTAQENVALPLIIDGVGEAEANRRATARPWSWSAWPAARSHFPRQLSGGEQQRLAIARALVARPLLLLGGRADRQPRQRHQRSDHGRAARSRGQQGQTILMVTHDARHAAMANRLLRLRTARSWRNRACRRAVRPVAEVLEDLETLAMIGWHSIDVVEVRRAADAAPAGTHARSRLLGIVCGVATIVAVTLTTQATRRAYHEMFADRDGPGFARSRRRGARRVR